MNDEHIKIVSKIQQHIDNHLQERITLLDLANLVSYSPFYLSRIFKEATGYSPFAYIRKLRLTEAAKILRDDQTKVLDIALDFFFDSHEGFTRAFSKHFGVNPKEYQLKPRPIKWFMPNNIMGYHLYKKRKELNVMQETTTIFTQVIERPVRKALIKRGIKAKGYFQYCEEVDCEIWGLLLSVKEALYEPVGMWLPEKMIKPGTSMYVQGVEVPADYAGEIPEGWDLIDLEPCLYLVFQGEPYDDSEFEIHVSKVMRAVEKFNPTPYGYVWDEEIAPRIQLEPQGERGYIEAKPIKPIK